MRGIVLLVCLVFVLGCGQAPPAGEAHITIADNKDWLKSFFQDPEKGDLVSYDVSVPETGVLTISLFDRTKLLFKSQGAIDPGTTRVGFHIQKITGKEIFKDQVAPILNSEEKDRFTQTFPDFMDRGLLKMFSVWSGNGPTTTWGAHYANYSQFNELTNKLRMGPTLTNGVFKIKSNKPAIIHSWSWGKNVETGLVNLTIDEDHNLTLIPSKGEPVPAEKLEAPVWVLVLQFAPKK